MEVLIRWKCHFPKEQCADCEGIAYHERWIDLDCLRFHSAVKYLICDRRFVAPRDGVHIVHRAWAKA
jgi:hypothetical protein